MKRSILLGLILFTAAPLCGATLNRGRLADAIYLAEGGPRAKVPYGVLTVKVRNAAEARQVCLHVIDVAWQDYSALRVPPCSFINFLADRYCPPADSIGNRNWKHNVSYFYETHHHP